jgi:hypothetical protein
MWFRIIFYLLKSANIQIIINVARTDIVRIILNNNMTSILLIERIFESFLQISNLTIFVHFNMSPCVSKMQNQSLKKSNIELLEIYQLLKINLNFNTLNVRLKVLLLQLKIVQLRI